MPQKHYELQDIGRILVSRRRGARNVRLSINAKGEVRVSIPYWLPYKAAVDFAQKRKEWILKNMQGAARVQLGDGARIGKSYRLKIIQSQDSKVRSRLTGQEVILTIPAHFCAAEVQMEAVKACEKALKKDAENLLGKRLEELSRRHGYSYKSLKIKKLTSRWGSCSSDKNIALSLYLIQLPWELIDYVILHELAHTVHLNHSEDFWQHFSERLPRAKSLKKEIRAYRPLIIPA